MTKDQLLSITLFMSPVVSCVSRIILLSQKEYGRRTLAPAHSTAGAMSVTLDNSGFCGGLLDGCS
ncbi:hypothetical protein BJY01DRAFT_211603 [Aspergillus pseudoustus]|uniref:Secreted protein n=1 Tax=Aspergillus pseudoustus TaxID=1810923 RepID=A0ABR4KBD7_9EURO